VRGGANARGEGVHFKAPKPEAQGKVEMCSFLWMAGFWMHQVLSLVLILGVPDFSRQLEKWSRLSDVARRGGHHDDVHSLFFLEK
jgi:hypothetical protein